MGSGSIVAAVRWVQRRRAPAPGWIGALLLVGLVAAAGPGAAVTLNPGDILIANHDNGVLRVNPANGADQTFVLTRPADDSAVYTGVAVAANGHLFVLDAGLLGFTAAKVIRVNPADGHPTVVSSGGNFFIPWSIAIAKNGDLFVADSGSGVIRVNPAIANQPPGYNQTVVSSGGHFREPRGIAIAANGDLLVADQECCGGKGGVIRVNPDTGHQTVVSSEGHFVGPHGIAIAANGDLLVADGGGVIRVNPAIANQPPGHNQTVVSSGGKFDIPRGIAITTDGDLLVLDGLCCGFQGGVIRVNPAIANQPPGHNQTVVAQQGLFNQPWGMAIVPPPDPGDILIANGAGANILEVKSRTISPWSWEPTVVSSGGYFVNPVGIAIAATGDLLVVDQNCCGFQGGVIRVNPVDGGQTLVASSASPGSHFVSPTGIAIAATGDLLVTDGNCCDGSNGGVIRVDPPIGNQPPGHNQTVVSSGGYFGNPAGIAIAANGDLLVVDPALGNAGVIRVNPAKSNQPPGSNQTVVSSGGRFMAPSGIAIAPNDDLLVVDATINDARVFRVNPTIANQPPGHNQTVVSSGGYFGGPTGIAVAATGDLFVVDPQCCGGFGGVIRVNPANGTQTVWAQGGKFVSPPGIAIIPPRPQPGLPPPVSCGGSVPCACGDLVVRDRTLRGVDPVTRTVCPADGLVVATGVTLDLGGATLRGQGAGAGVRIESGATDATIRHGKITGFATGVRGEGTTGVHVANVQVLDSAQDGVNLTGEGHTVETAVIKHSGGLGVAVIGNAGRLSRLQVQSNGRAGVRLLGGGHTVEQSAIEGNGEAGAEVSGDANEVARLQVTGNGGDGVFVMGKGNRVTRNNATRNGEDGLEIQGERASVESNRATSNGGAGLEIHGIEHTVSLNIAGQNTGTGLEMLGTTGSRFDRNRGENNGGSGIADDSTGTGTSGTANTYTQNLCGRGNGAGTSSPPGLCR